MHRTKFAPLCYTIVGMHHQPDEGVPMEPPMQETPIRYPPHSQPNLYQPEPQAYPHMGSITPAMRANSPEMPTILETNSQAPSPAGSVMLNPSLDHEHHPHQMQQAEWNPTNSWLPPAGTPQSHPSSLTGHYPVDRLSSSKQAKLHTAPSATGGNKRSQSLPYRPGEAKPPRGGLGADPYARRSYVEEGLRHAYSGGGLGPETPSPQEQRTASRMGYEDSPQVCCTAMCHCCIIEIEVVAELEGALSLCYDLLSKAR